MPNLVMGNNLSLVCKGILKSESFFYETGKTVTEENTDTFSFYFEGEQYLGSNWYPESNYGDWSCSWSKQSIKCKREPYKQKTDSLIYKYISIDRVSGVINSSIAYLVHPVATLQKSKFKGSCEIGKKSKF